MPACTQFGFLHPSIPACLDPADAKVCYLGAAVDIKEDVLGLEVPVHDAGVQVRQPLCHIMRYLQVPRHAEALQERLTLKACITWQG